MAEDSAKEKEARTLEPVTGLDLVGLIDQKERELKDLRAALELLKRQGLVMVVGSHTPIPTSEEFKDMMPLEAVRIILRRMGRASTRELHDALMAGGIRTRARNFINSIGATLVKAEDITKEANGAWRLKTPEEMREGLRDVGKH